jgi:cytochrome c oxidase subunit 3
MDAENTAGKQAAQSGKLGMWIFLCSELLLFGSLLCAFFVFRMWHTDAFNEGANFLSATLGSLCTLFLITGSFTMAVAENNLRINKIKATVLNLLFTLICASVFIVMKYYEYSHNIQAGALWPGLFSAQDLIDPGSSLFFGLYFLISGLHSLHVLVGVYLLIRLIKRAMRYQYGSTNTVAMEITGLFWHMGVFVWIILFPLIYLV